MRVLNWRAGLLLGMGAALSGSGGFEEKPVERTFTPTNPQPVPRVRQIRAEQARYGYSATHPALLSANQLRKLCRGRDVLSRHHQG